MKTIFLTTLATGLLVSFASLAAAPAGAPAGSTGLCKDGTYYSGAEKKGACSGHNGVKEWWGAAPAAKGETKSESQAAAPKPATAPKAATAPVAGPAPAPAAATSKTEATKPTATQAPGAKPGTVWVNESSKVYHCAGDQWYGKTKQGAYMTEADAKAKGFRPDHGKACQ